MPSKSLKSPAESSAKSATKSLTKGSSKSRTLSKKKIFSTALALVDEKGLSSLSLRALGQRLGVSQAAFYRHVPNKSALLEGVSEEVLRRALESFISGVERNAEVYGQMSWQNYLRAYAVSLHDTLLQHPNAIMLVLTHPISTPGQLSLFAKMLTNLSKTGFSAPLDMLGIATAVTVYTTGFSASEAVPPVGSTSEEDAPSLSEAIESLPSDELDALSMLIGDIMEGKWDFSTQFERGLDALLQGWK